MTLSSILMIMISSSMLFHRNFTRSTARMPLESQCKKTLTLRKSTRTKRSIWILVITVFRWGCRRKSRSIGKTICRLWRRTLIWLKRLLGWGKKLTYSTESGASSKATRRRKMPDSNNGWTNLRLLRCLSSSRRRSTSRTWNGSWTCKLQSRRTGRSSLRSKASTTTVSRSTRSSDRTMRLSSHSRKPVDSSSEQQTSYESINPNYKVIINPQQQYLI